MWEINVVGQAITFALSLALGGVLCTFYDVLRAIRKAGINSFWSVFLTDIIFWVVSAFVTFIFLISRTNGEIRGYVLIGEIFGFVIFRISISKILFSVFLFLLVNVKKIYMLMAKNFYCLYYKSETIFIKIWLIMVKKTKRVGKTIKKLLKNRGKLLYTDNNNANMENVVDETKTQA